MPHDDLDQEAIRNYSGIENNPGKLESVTPRHSHSPRPANNLFRWTKRNLARSASRARPASVASGSTSRRCVANRAAKGTVDWELNAQGRTPRRACRRKAEDEWQQNAQRGLQGTGAHNGASPAAPSRLAVVVFEWPARELRRSPDRPYRPSAARTSCNVTTSVMGSCGHSVKPMAR